MGHDDTRGKGASDSPKPADEGASPVSELGDLHSAFDSIDDTMKEVTRREVTVTPETLEQIVNDAVAKAITAYEQARGGSPESPAASQGGMPEREKLERLQGELGLDEIEFDSAPTEPAERIAHGALSKQMGVHDFELDDIPGAPAQPDAPEPLDIGSVTEWMNTSAAATNVEQLRATAGGKAKTREGEQDFDWVAAELAALDAAEPVVAPAPPAAPPPAPEPPRYAAPEPVVPPIEPPRPAPMPEARETRSGLAGWFRSALGDKSPQREPARVPVPGPKAPAKAADSVARQPEPEVVPPAAIVARPEEKPRPAREPGPALKPAAAEEAVDTIRFTFDPIPPVPPPLPRETHEPPKKINKPGRFP